VLTKLKRRFFWFVLAIARVIGLTFCCHCQFIQDESLPTRMPIPTLAGCPMAGIYPPEVHFEISRDAFLIYPKEFLPSRAAQGGRDIHSPEWISPKDWLKSVFETKSAP